MNRNLRLLRAACLLAVAWLISSEVARADGVVADCTESALLDALFGGGLVTFDQDCEITNTATIEISTDTTIDTQGHSVTISGGGAIRVFNVEPNVSLTLIGLTIADGLATNGGAFYLDSGSSLLLTNCTVGANQVKGPNGTNGLNGADNPGGNAGNGTSGTNGPPASGGAVYNLGSLTVLNSTFAGNKATGGTGGNGGNGGNGRLNGGNGGNGGVGAAAKGGAIFSLGTLTVMDSSFINNSVIAGAGGSGGTNGTGAGGIPGSGARGGEASGAGIYSTQRVTIARSTFDANAATGGAGVAGGMLSNGNGQTGPTGGASFGAGVFTTGGGAVTNSTFFANVATGGAGGNGGAGNLNAGNGGNGGTATGGGFYSTGTVAVVNCTFSSCAAVGGTNGLAGSSGAGGSPGSLGASRGGDLANGSGAFTLMNSIIASNLAGGNGFGTIIDASNNISSDASIALGPGSRKSIDARIGVLADNGGPTETIAPLAGSPAIDDTNILVFPPTDQRGIARPGGKAPDIGAYEIAPPYILTQPVSQSQTNGGRVTLTVVAAGDPVLKYQWRFNGSRIVGATDSAYSIPSFTTSNAGNYDVTVTNSLGGTTSAVATVTFPYISGRIMADSSGLAGVQVTAGPRSTITGADGRFAFSNLLAGSYQVTPALDNYVFVPASIPITLPPSPAELSFSAFTSFTISGTVSAGANGLAGITVSASTNSAVSDANGNYTMNGVRAGDYFVHASSTRYNFNPVEVIVGPSTNNVNFPAVSTNYTVSGHVRYGTNGLANVKIFGKQTTDANGFYSLSFIEGTNVLAPVLTGYSFRPTSIAVVTPPDVSNVDFQGGAIISAVTRLSSGAVKLAVSGGPFVYVRVQASSDLKTWTSLYTNIPPFQFTDTAASGFPVRFYRTSQP